MCKNSGRRALPDVQQIKQKLGGLRVYTRKCNQNLLDELDARIDEIERTYEKCGNAAQVQSIQGYLTTLCCWCYNDYLEDRFEGAEAKWPADLELDFADRSPDLVSADTASLKPSVGPGWLVLLGQFLQAAEHVVRKTFEDPVLAQITDVKTNRDGSIHISFSRYHDMLGSYPQTCRDGQQANMRKVWSCGRYRPKKRPGDRTVCTFSGTK